MPTTLSDELEKTYPEMDVSALTIDNYVGCSLTYPRQGCRTVTSKSKFRLDDKHQVVEIISPGVGSCASCPQKRSTSN